MQNDMKNLANELKVLRAKNGMTQEDLAKASGVSPCAIALIESCKKKPRVATILKIAKAFKIGEEETQKLLDYIL